MTSSARRFSIRAAVLSAAFFVVSGCTTSERLYCEKAAECDDQFGLLDPVGNSSDSVDVCQVNQETFLAALRANSEEICQQRAEAEIAWMNCVAEEGCDSFNLLEEECKDEYERRLELSSESGNRCNE